MSHVPIATTPVWKAIAPSLESTRSRRGCKYHLHGALLLPSEIMRLLLAAAAPIVRAARAFPGMFHRRRVFVIVQRHGHTHTCEPMTNL